MKEYVRKDENISYNTSIVYNNPLKGYAKKITEVPSQILGKNITNGTKGMDNLLTERFN